MVGFVAVACTAVRCRRNNARVFGARFLDELTLSLSAHLAPALEARARDGVSSTQKSELLAAYVCRKSRQNNDSLSADELEDGEALYA
jgi:hypothetical protein